MSDNAKKLFIHIDPTDASNQQQYYYLNGEGNYQLLEKPGITDQQLPNFSWSRNMQYFVYYCNPNTCVGKWD